MCVCVCVCVCVSQDTTPNPSSLQADDLSTMSLAFNTLIVGKSFTCDLATGRKQAIKLVSDKSYTVESNSHFY